MPESSRHRGILWPRSCRWAMVHHLSLEKREKCSASEQFTCATRDIFTEGGKWISKLDHPESSGLGWPLGICIKISTCCKLQFLSEETDPHCFYESTEYSQVSKRPSLIHVLDSSQQCLPIGFVCHWNCLSIYHQAGMSLCSVFRHVLRK